MKKHLAGLWIVALAAMLLAGPVFAQDSSPNNETGQQTIVKSGEIWPEDLVIVGGWGHIEEGALVQGDVAMMAGELLIEGSVEGGVVAFGGSLELGPEAHVAGDVVAFGELRRDPAAVIGGNLIEGSDAKAETQGWERFLSQVPAGEMLGRALDGTRSMAGVPWLVGRLGILVLLVLASWALAATHPGHIANVTRVMTGSVLLSFGIGLLTMLLVALLGTLLSIILIGLPVALILVLALFGAMMLGWVALGALTGERLLALFSKATTTPVTSTVAGTCLITLLALVPCLGLVAVLIAQCWAVGAVVLTRFGTRPDSGWAVELGRRMGVGHGGVGWTAGTPAAPSKTGDTKRLNAEMAPPDVLADEPGTPR